MALAELQNLGGYDVPRVSSENCSPDDSFSATGLLHSVQNRTPDAHAPAGKNYLGPPVYVPLVVSLGAHIGICGTQVQETKSIVDVNLGKFSVARGADV